MGGENVFADQMDVRGPESIDRGLWAQVFQGGNIIHERVEPDIGDVILVERQLDAP